MVSNLICVLFAAGLVRAAAGLPFAGPFIINGDNITECEEHKKDPPRVNIMLSSVNPKQPSSVQILNGNFTMSNDVDDANWGHLIFDSHSSDGRRWNKNAIVFKFPFKACSAFRDNVPDAARVIFRMSLARNQPCLVKQGLYKYQNQPVNWTFPNVPVVPYGHFRFTLSGGRDKPQKKPDFCITGYTNSFPPVKPAKTG